MNNIPRCFVGSIKAYFMNLLVCFRTQVQLSPWIAQWMVNSWREINAKLFEKRVHKRSFSECSGESNYDLINSVSKPTTERAMQMELEFILNHSDQWALINENKHKEESLAIIQLQIKSPRHCLIQVLWPFVHLQFVLLSDQVTVFASLLLV